MTEPSTSFEGFLRGKVRAVTAQSYCKRVRLLAKLGDIEQPDKIRSIICAYPVSEARKELLTNAYYYYCEFKGYEWIKPNFTREDKAFFLPLETELNQLIANTRDKLSTFLQLLKETGADCGEAWKLKWIDIDCERKTVAITPTKNHNSRILPVSSTLLARLLKLPRLNESVRQPECAREAERTTRIQGFL